MEAWQPISTYEGIYEISDFGRVKSLNYNRERKEKILKPSLQGNKYRKYCCITLFKDGKPKTTLIHRLVALHFVPNPDNKPQVNHIDNDPFNNHVSNLEWVTSRENNNHGYTFHKTSSKYPGVSWYKSSKKWYAKIYINGKRKYLGCFKEELDAAQAYQTALTQFIS